MASSLKEWVRTGLIRLEKYIEADIVYLTTQSGWLVLNQVILSVVAFALSVAFAHLVNKDDYGTYRFLVSLFWILSAFSLTGLPTALIRAIARGEDGAYGLTIRVSLLGSIPVALASLVLAGYYFFQNNMLLAGGISIIGVLGVFQQCTYLYGAFLEGKRRFREAALWSTVLSIVPSALIFGAMFVAPYPLVFLTLYLGGSVVCAAFISLTVWRRYKSNGVEPAFGFLSLGAHLSVMNVLTTLSQQIDKLLVFHALGAAPLAVYAFATAIPDQIKSVFSTFATVSFPKFASQSVSESMRTIRGKVIFFTVLIALATGAYIIVAPYFFEVFFPNYHDAVQYTILYALALIPIGSMFPVTILEAHAARRELYIFNVLGPIVQIAALALLIAWYGLIGAIIARIVGRVFYFALATLLLRSYARRIIK